MMKPLLIAALAALLLAACGGGGSAEVPLADDPLAEVPARAAASPQGFVGYLGGLPPLAAEMREPMALDAFVPPTSEDSEPQEVD